MKLPAERLKAAARRKREEAGEVVRPAKKSRRKAQGELAQASAAPVETAPMEESRESVPAEAPMRGDIPAMAEVGPERRGQSAQVEEAVNGPSAPAEPAEVVDLEAEDETPVPTEPAEAANLGAEGGHPAPPEPKVRGIAPEAGDEEGPADDGGVEPTTL